MQPGSPPQIFKLCLKIMVVICLSMSIVLPSTAAADGRWEYQPSCDQTPQPGYASCLGIRGVFEAAGTEPAARSQQSAAPNSYRSTPVPGALTPADLRDAYQLPTDTTVAATQTLAIVDAYDDPTAEADLAVYSDQYGLPPCTSANGCFTKINQNGGTSMPAANGSWASEISLDVQMAHAVCQSCKILLVEANSNLLSDLGAAVNKAVGLGADEISNSYGGSESSGLISDTHYDHPGVVITASAGDDGYLDNQAESGGGVPEYPASSPYVLSVGGTSLMRSSGVWSSTVWADSGGGCSTVFSAPDWQSQADGYSALDCDKRAENDVAVIGNPATGVSIYDSTPDGSKPTGWMLYGGTSAGAPIIAGEYGLAGGSGGVAFPASTLYSHQNEPGEFYDVTAGTNAPSCNSNICRAVVGLDGPTGLGSPLGLDALTPDASGAPGLIALPKITGDPLVGSTLTAVRGSYSGAGPFSYIAEWERCDATGSSCQTIPGASSTSYVVGAADLGSTLVYTETAYGSRGSIIGVSLPTAVVTQAQTPSPPITVQPGGVISVPPPAVQNRDPGSSQLKIRSHRLLIVKNKAIIPVRCYGTGDCTGNVVLTSSRHGRRLTLVRHYRLRPGNSSIKLPLTHGSRHFALRKPHQAWISISSNQYRVLLARRASQSARDLR